MIEMKLVPCCGQASCGVCLGRPMIPSKESLQQFARERASNHPTEPRRKKRWKVIPASELLERAYALNECESVREAGDALNITPSCITKSLYQAMCSRYIRPRSSSVFAVRGRLKELIALLESEVNGWEVIG